MSIQKINRQLRIKLRDCAFALCISSITSLFLHNRQDLCSKLKRNKWEKKCLQLFIFTREKKNRVVWFGFDSTPRNRNWLLRCLSFCFWFSFFFATTGFKFITLENFGKTGWLWNTLTIFVYFYLKVSLLDTTFRICPGVKRIKRK